MSSKVSVIVPVYNVAPFLCRCLDSILTQTYRDIEVILIDDGSTDNSGVICDEYANKDRRIIVIHQENKGVSSARNIGLEQCSGEYISFVDPDDWIEKSMFRDMIQAIEDHNVDFAVCNETHVLDDGSGMKTKKINHWPEIKDITVLFNQDLYRRVFACSAVIWNKIFKRSIIDGHRLNPKLTYGEDAAYFLEILLECNSAVIVPHNYYYYDIKRPGNVVSSTINERSLEFLENAKMYYLTLLKRGYPDVGVHRLYIAIKEVLMKIPSNSIFDSRNSQYLYACKKLSRVPSRYQVLLYLISRLDTVKGKCLYILMRSNLRLWLKWETRTHNTFIDR